MNVTNCKLPPIKEKTAANKSLFLRLPIRKLVEKYIENAFGSYSLECRMHQGKKFLKVLSHVTSLRLTILQLYYVSECNNHK